MTSEAGKLNARPKFLRTFPAQYSSVSIRLFTTVSTLPALLVGRAAICGTIHALITNEYHDPFSRYCSQGYTGPGNRCWYNSITNAFSTDEGLTFTHATPPAHVVAPPWEKRDASTGTPTPYGYFFPSNIVLGPDNAYYSLFFSWARAGDESICLMRTHTLSDPSS
jgi:hypothetical protein